jgi:hypothetical protein
MQQHGIAQLVFDHWRSENIRLKEPLPQDQIVRHLESLGVSPLPELLDAYTILSRFDDDEMDNECLCFWSLEKVTEENRSGAKAVQFADFLIDSHRYAFRIESDNSIGIYIDYFDGKGIKIADSFSSFFRIYLGEPGKLHA